MEYIILIYILYDRPYTPREQWFQQQKQTAVDADEALVHYYTSPYLFTAVWGPRSKTSSAY